jgi:hypothetical protein
MGGPCSTNGEIKTNSVALVRERTIPTERPPLVGEVSPTFADREVSHGQCDGSPTAVISIFQTGEIKTIESNCLPHR